MKYHLIYLIGLVLLFSTLIQSKCIVRKPIQKNKIGYRIVDAEEAAALLLSNRNYYENLTQNDLNYRMQKLNATLEEFERFVQKQTLNFTDQEKKLIGKSIKTIESICDERGYRLPPMDNIIFAKTTSLEEDEMEGYTHGTQIYLTKKLFDWIIEEDNIEYSDFNAVIAHELFHCLTRNYPKFRKDMYSILGFTVMDKDIEFPKETLDQIISNPDVEHHNSYATFNINGVKKNCSLILSTTKPFEKPGDHFNDYQKTGLVPIDDLYTIYSRKDALDFYDVLGKNTDYNIDPEETLADNFMYTITDIDYDYKTKNIIKSIDAYLKSYKP